jgi:hypothetical protein
MSGRRDAGNWPPDASDITAPSKLVHESGWSPDKFQHWLEETLLATLTNCG